MGRSPAEADFRPYVQAIADARYVMRRIARIADEQARAAGLEPLANQALIQVIGHRGTELSVSGLAERLDVVPAFASRLVKSLESDGYVRRDQGSADRRVVTVVATELGEATSRSIDRAVRRHIDFFAQQLGDHERTAALDVFRLFVGLAEPEDIA